jgi:6-pyruvoyltetrahydropterin/6-carboxytetrahydropterin synthase
MNRLYFTASAPFEAACRIEILPPGHRSRHLHGHSFLARVRRVADADGTYTGAEAEDLSRRLRAAIAPLDYSDLNRHLPVPTDENLTRWVRQRLPETGIDRVGVQSTRDQGADLDHTGQAHIWRRFRFEAAHQMPNVPEGHKCGRMHGHGFEVIVHANQDLKGSDMGVDFDRLEALWAPFHEELHLNCMNDIAGLENPTSERLSHWIWERLKPALPALSRVTVYETATAGCHYDGANYQIWKDFRFESALRLTRAPRGDRRRRLHGHSYLARLHLTAPLDEVMGWTVDYGDVKALFEPAYKQLDHHPLNGLEGIEHGDAVSLLRWIRAQLAEAIPQLDRVDLYETPGCGAVLCWGDQGPALPV